MVKKVIYDGLSAQVGHYSFTAIGGIAIRNVATEENWIDPLPEGSVIPKNFNFNIQTHLDTSFPEGFLELKLTDLYCKHIIRQAPEARDMFPQSEKLLEESKKLGYDICEWGLHSGHPSDLQYHLDKIIKMIDNEYDHAVRIVACKYDFQDTPVLWIDNLHSAIKYVAQYGGDVTLGEIPFYLVDITDYDKPAIYGRNGSVRENYEDIIGAVSCAYKRFQRSNSKELIDVGYKLKHFLADNGVLLYDLCQHLENDIRQRTLW